MCGTNTYSQEFENLIIDISKVKFNYIPKINLDLTELAVSNKDVINRKLSVAVDVDKNGNTKSVIILKSSNIRDFDNIILEHLKKCTFEPYEKNGEKVDFRFIKTFNLPDVSKITWKNLKLNFSNSDLKNYSRRILIKVEVNKRGEIVSLKIKKTSGISDFDELILSQVKKIKFFPIDDFNDYDTVFLTLPLIFELNTNSVDKTFNLQTNIIKDNYLEKDNELYDLAVRIKKNIFDLWDVPEFSEGLKATVSFNITNDYLTDSIKVIESSGDKDFDNSTAQAVRKFILSEKLTKEEKIIFLNRYKKGLIRLTFKAK